MKSSNTFKQIEGQRDGREGGRDQSKRLALHMCTYLWHHSYDASARKKQKSTSVSILFNTQLFPPPYTAHNVCLIRRIKLAGWVWMLPHALQFEK